MMYANIRTALRRRAQGAEPQDPEMGGLVEKQIEHAISGLVDRNDEMCRATIERDHVVNAWTSRSTTSAYGLLALHQPAAKDLRLITTGLKITTDLERIGDNRRQRRERALELNQEPQLKPFIDIPRMADCGADHAAAEPSTAFVNEECRAGADSVPQRRRDRSADRPALPRADRVHGRGAADDHPCHPAALHRQATSSASPTTPPTSRR